jgi:hypothetical protein
MILKGFNMNELIGDMNQGGKERSEKIDMRRCLTCLIGE